MGSRTSGKNGSSDDMVWVWNSILDIDARESRVLHRPQRYVLENEARLLVFSCQLDQIRDLGAEMLLVID